MACFQPICDYFREGLVWDNLLQHEIAESKYLISAMFPQVVGGAEGTRTPYLFNAIESLSQLSYSPNSQLYQNIP